MKVQSVSGVILNNANTAPGGVFPWWYLRYRQCLTIIDSAGRTAREVPTLDGA